jgi:hypothetical protein
MMNAGDYQRTGTEFCQRATDASFILTQAAVIIGFVVRFEPPLCDILAVLALVAGLPVLGRNIARLPRIVVISLLVFISINAVGLISAVSVKSAIRFFGITAYLIAFSILIYSLTWEKDGFRQQIIKAYMIAAFVTATLIWAGFFGNILSLPLLSRMTFADRPMGLFKDPNVAGSFLIPGALFMSATILEEGRARSVSLWGALFLIVSAIFHTASRSAVLCWGLGLMVLIVPSGTSLRRKLVHLAAVACIVLVVLPVMYACTSDGIAIGLSGRVLPHMGYVESLVHGAQRYMADIAGRFGTESHFATGSGLLQRDNMKPFAVGLYGYDTGGRLYAWKAALELWKSHPVIGIGPGAFELLSPDIQRKLGASFITASAHSTYLRVLAENGVIGLVSLVIPLIFAVVVVAKTGSPTVGRACGETVCSADSRTVGGARDNTMGNVGGTAQQGTEKVGKAGTKTAGKTCDEAVSRAGAKNNALWLTGDRLWLTASLIALIANGLFMDSLHFRHLWLVFALALREVRTD